jgi:quercetin dioxygenase-like cupin family protein
MKKITTATLLLAAMTLGITAKAEAPSDTSEPVTHAMNIRYEDLKWEKIVPELGARSSEIAILRVDPNTKATHLMIRVPKDFHVPRHWHTANETHTIVKGKFIMESEGKRQMLRQGSWNFVPSRMVHEAWTTPTEGALLYITVDSAWDINWADGPPKPSDFLGGRKK